MTPVTVTLTDSEAECLWHTMAAARPMRAQLEDRDPRTARFDRRDASPYDGTEPMWEAGTLYWCCTASDALLLRAFERASGFEAIYLFDEGWTFQDPNQDGHTVLSTRPLP